MDDSTLTKKAIEELLREMNDTRETDGMLTERKKNPLGKPNKRFLGRTINSMMKHNKRQSDNNHRRCQRKLKELDAKQRKREHGQTHKTLEKDIYWQSRTQRLYEVVTSDSEKSDPKEKNLKKRKRKKKPRSSPPTSSSSNRGNSSTSCDSEYSDSTNPPKFKNHKHRKAVKNSSSLNNDEREQEFYSPMVFDHPVGYYVDPHMAYAAMAYGHINHVLRQQTVQQQQTIKDELEESVEIPSDLSISDHSESSINICVHSSSAEEDENGILTFKLLSSDEERKSLKSKNINEKRKPTDNFEIITLVESDDSNKSSIKSCISFESRKSQKSNRQVDEILLSSSTSDCDDLEVIETLSETVHIQSKNEINEYKMGSIVDIRINNINEIEHALINTKDDYLPENKLEESTTQSLEIEKANEDITMDKKGQGDFSINKKEIKKMENGEETDKDTNNTIKDHNDDFKDENEKVNEIILPEHFTSTQTIDLTEE